MLALYQSCIIRTVRITCVLESQNLIDLFREDFCQN